MVREVVTVIGAGGMGLAIARRMGAGRRLVLGDCDADRVNAAADLLTEDGFDVEACVVDVANAESVGIVACMSADLGAVAALVHTAGVSPADASVPAILQVDLLGTAHVLDAFGGVVAAGGAGVVIASMAGTIFSSSLSGEDENRLASTAAVELLGIPSIKSLLDGDPDDAGNRSIAYGIAKRGNQLRVRAEAARWGARGARLNSISPGVISTSMGRAELADPSAGGMITSMVEGSPVGRVGTVDDIAAVTEFLTSRAAGFITGTDVLADGGVVAAMLTPQQVSLL